MIRRLNMNRKYFKNCISSRKQYLFIHKEFCIFKNDFIENYFIINKCLKKSF